MIQPNHLIISDMAPPVHLAGLRADLRTALTQIAEYDPVHSESVPSISSVNGNIHDVVSGTETIPADILVDYATVLKFEEDAMAQYGNREPDYWSKLDRIGNMAAENLRSLYEAGNETNPLRAMVSHEVSRKPDSSSFLASALNVVKKVYGTATIAELVNTPDPTIEKLRAALRHGDTDVHDFYRADTGDTLQPGSQERRAWMRNAVMLATDVPSLEQADAYIYSMNQSALGEYNLSTLVERINSYGADKLQAIREFSGNNALSSYSDNQLDRLYKLSQGDPAEIERLKNHDVIAVLVNMDGDHGGLSLNVMGRLDDEGDRLIPFEITHPGQVYGYLKKLHDLGILASTLIFALHGMEGQCVVAERPPLDADDSMMHITTVIDQDLADHISAREQNLKGYDIAKANGLIRAIQRFMQPSRAIDDPDKDLGRKKIISLSCEFDGEANRASLGVDGEKIKGEKTTLLRRLGEVIIGKLQGEHIDIYGAGISTNQQTRTKRGFHYNQNRNGRRQPYPASVLHIDNADMQWHKLNEVQLRK